MSRRRPLVTIVVLNRNGKEHLEACLPALEALAYPRDRLEVMVVDNGSTDGSVAFVRENFPRAIVVRKMRNEGYARPNNEAARMAGGSYIAFLNNDVRVEANWLERMLRPMRPSGGVVCVASKMLSWDGKRIDYAGSSVNFEGRGFQEAFGEGPDQKGTSYRETLFPCSGAMLIQKEAFLDAGGFDEDLFWHYVDVDLGWRLWVLGYRVIYSPDAVCYHVHGGTSSAQASHKKSHLLERNGILTAVKNLEEENLLRVLPTSLLLQAHRGTMGGEIRRRRYAAGSEEPLGEGERLEVASAVPLVALHSIAEALPLFLRKRKEIHARRRRTDSEIISRFGESWSRPASDDLGGRYRALQRELFRIFDVGKAARVDGTSPRRILIISTDYVGEEMAGPAIRCWEFARQLAREFRVTLAAPNETNLQPDGFRLFSYSPKNLADLRKWAAASDVIFVQGFALYHLSFLKELRKIFIVDLYCPFPIENLNVYRYNEWEEEDRKKIHSLNLIVANEQILIGDFFVCANERQRDYWLGVLTALNRLNVETFDHDTSLEKTIATVPFGISDRPPAKTRRVLKGVVPGIGRDDRVIIWAGGIFNWFDPETLVSAMGRLAKSRPDVKLFFLGTRHPNPEIPAMKVQERTIRLAKDLGLYGRTVFFNEKGYVPYEERADYLLESDFGVSTHRRGVEARLASRTRFMDYLWAGLPIICTEGDSLAETVAREGLGEVVPVADPEALAEAIVRLASDADRRRGIRERIASVRHRFLWGKVVEPILDFCREAAHAPDKGPGRAALPGLLRLHREIEVKEGALDLVSEKLEMQDQAKRRAEAKAAERQAELAASHRREQELSKQVHLKDQHIRNLESLVQALKTREHGLNQKAIELKNLENHIRQRQQQLAGKPDGDGGVAGKARRWLRSKSKRGE